MQRKVRLEAGERARRPSVRILEAATVPQSAWRPDYGRDALLSVVGSLLLALLATWLVELFNRSDPQPAVVIAQPIAYPMMVGASGNMPQTHEALAAQARPALTAEPVGLLPSGTTFPRELAEDEIAALLDASTGRARLAAMLLLSGLAIDEIVLLERDDLDRASHRVRLQGISPRTIELPEPVWAALDRPPDSPGARMLSDESGSAPTAEDIALEIFYAAHDAGIVRPSEVTPDALRHSYLAFLVRQGIRLGDLVRIVGRLTPERAAAYGDLAPPGERIALEAVNRLMPGMPA